MIFQCNGTQDGNDRDEDQSEVGGSEGGDVLRLIEDGEKGDDEAPQSREKTTRSQSKEESIAANGARFSVVFPANRAGG